MNDRKEISKDVYPGQNRLKHHRDPCQNLFALWKSLNCGLQCSYRTGNDWGTWFFRLCIVNLCETFSEYDSSEEVVVPQEP
jgi:hypothetical protein